MTQPTTLRPREKIQARSVRSLSDHELLQVIIGNGSGQYSVKRLARAVLKLYRASQKVIIFDDLLKIPGVGIAKAARLAATLEFARRYKQQPVNTVQLLDELLAPAVHSVAWLAILSLDGAKRIIRSERLAIPDPLDGQSVQLICRWLVLDNASYVCLTVRDVTLDAAAEHCRLIFRAVRSVGVHLLEFRWNDGDGGKSLYVG